MTDRCNSPEDLDRLFGPEEQQPGGRSEQDSARLLEARIAQLVQQQRIFEEAHQQIMTQHLETSDTLLTEQRSAYTRLEQEVAVRTKTSQERVVALEQAKAVSESEKLAIQQRLLAVTYAIDAQTKAILEAAAILGRDIDAVNNHEAHEAVESIRSSAIALLNLSDTGCRDTRGAADPSPGHPLGAGGLRGNHGSPVDSDRVFDYDAALARAGGDAVLLKELATLFLTDGPKHLVEVKTAISKGDGAVLGLAAHTLKGAAGLFDAGEVIRSASQLERLRRAGDLEHAERMCADLEAAMARLLDALKQL